MHIVDEIISETKPQERTLYSWQFALSLRLMQIMEEQQLTQCEFSSRVGVTEQELDDLIHYRTDPPMSLLARIAAHSNSELLTWVNTDV
jgi:transcriptional regulator with XRE-family HTH domain